MLSRAKQPLRLCTDHFAAARCGGEHNWRFCSRELRSGRTSHPVDAEQPLRQRGRHCLPRRAKLRAATLLHPTKMASQGAMSCLDKWVVTLHRGERMHDYCGIAQQHGNIGNSIAVRTAGCQYAVAHLHYRGAWHEHEAAGVGRLLRLDEHASPLLAEPEPCCVQHERASGPSRARRHAHVPNTCNVRSYEEGGGHGAASSAPASNCGSLRGR